MKNYLLLLMAAFMIGVTACEKQEMEMEEEEEEEMMNECDTEGVTYEGEIKSILSGCTGSSCHGSNTGRSMANYADAVNYAKQGRILGAIKREAGFSPMPKNGAKLAQCKIDQIEAWIDDDYPEG
ncbi:hypothetical protein [Portibacter marinus]|uniref:hypothetical protein n=1 Tax=Portibacter marinus TaxID=2898660 RepID=UPI001F3BD820|nr:hypothetical protein [Portibacter marinus]